uniref:Uncharacterized protein n=1 Tax=Anguilla anguilla TaxID=7936 RepID=A0A0E9QGS5_ANGAN
MCRMLYLRTMITSNTKRSPITPH